jgi:hypothetical protein
MTGIIGFAVPARARADKLRRVRIRLKTKGENVVRTTIEDRHQYEALVKANER